MCALRLVTFDVTGTLLLFRKPVFQQYAERAEKFGIIADSTKLQSRFKEAWKKQSREHPNFGRATGNWQKWWREIVVRTVFEPADEAASKMGPILADDLISFYTKKNAWIPANGAVEILEKLKTKNIQMGIISNFDPRLHLILKNCELDRFFSFIITSYEAGWEKPDKRIFDMALRLASIENPEQAVHVGNSIENDCEGAKNAGMHSVLISQDVPQCLPRTISDISHLIECLDKISCARDRRNK